MEGNSVENMLSKMMVKLTKSVLCSVLWETQLCFHSQKVFMFLIFSSLYFDHQTFQETPSKKKNRMTSRVDGRRMTIMANVAARQKKADFTNLERDFKKKFQSLRKNLNHYFKINNFVTKVI
jgi:hypothetical protein